MQEPQVPFGEQQETLEVENITDLPLGVDISCEEPFSLVLPNNAEKVADAVSSPPLLSVSVFKTKEKHIPLSVLMFLSVLMLPHVTLC